MTTVVCIRSKTMSHTIFFSDRILADSECPLAIKSMWKNSNAKQNYFQLGQRKNGLLKVFYKTEGKNGTESFHNIIVTPSTSSQQLVKMISEKLHVPHQKYELVEKSSSGEGKEVGKAYIFICCVQQKG